MGKSSSRISMEIIKCAHTVILYESKNSENLFWQVVCTDGFIFWVTHRRVPLLFLPPTSFANMVCQSGELQGILFQPKRSLYLSWTRRIWCLQLVSTVLKHRIFSFINELQLGIYQFLHKKSATLCFIGDDLKPRIGIIPKAYSCGLVWTPCLL